jgi:hypothetical protein
LGCVLLSQYDDVGQPDSSVSREPSRDLADGGDVDRSVAVVSANCFGGVRPNADSVAVVAQ